MKTCSTCKQPKDLVSFSKDNKKSDGLRSNCKICAKKPKTIWYQQNKLSVLESVNKWSKLNSDKKNASDKRWRDANPEQQCIRTRKYQASKINRIPSCITQIQLNEIAEFYVLAKELRWLSEQPLEVDHIIPLQGKNVSGLHVPWNLQIIPKSVNCSKGNRI